MSNLLVKYQQQFSKLFDFNPAKEQLLRMDFTAANTALKEELFTDTEKFSAYIQERLAAAGAAFGIGGYLEHRELYARSALFGGTEPRRLHLGIDIWGKAGTKVYAPLGGIVHSVGYHEQKGDYGGTIILQHQFDAYVFYTLYGHVSIRDTQVLQERAFISQGELLAHFGAPVENGHWPPHLHFQVIEDLQGHRGDYPGVCRVSEKDKYADNCPDPDIILQLMQYAK